MAPAYEVIEKRVLDSRSSGTGGWTAVVRLADGRNAYCSLSRGNRVRVAFKPRDFVGFKWYGRVMVGGRTLWDEECAKSASVALMLEAAGLVGRRRCPDCRKLLRVAEPDGPCYYCAAGREHRDRLFYAEDAPPLSETFLGRSRLDGRELWDHSRALGWSRRDDRDRWAGESPAAR